MATPSTACPAMVMPAPATTEPELDAVRSVAALRTHSSIMEPHPAGLACQRAKAVRHLAPLVLILVFGCGDNAAPTRPPLPVSPQVDQLQPPAPPPHSADQLFSSEAVWPIHIGLSEASRAALSADPYTYVVGSVAIGGKLFEEVGIRLKGAYSFQGLGGKAAFKIKFNEYVADQRFLGLERLTLNNMRQDRSKVHEWLGYELFRAVGVSASRSGYVQLWLNGENYGLYANVESVDDRFLRERYADATGNLYEAPWGADLDLDSIWDFEQDEGEDLSRDDLLAFVEAANQPGDGIFVAPDTPLATDEFLAFVAAEAAIGHWDGYWKANNYHIYHEPGAERWSFIPWGIDQAFDRELGVFAGAGMLIAKCREEPACVVAYAETGLAVADAFADLDLEASLDEVAALIEEALIADPRQPHPVDMVHRHLATLRALLATTPARLRSQFDCLEAGVEADRDDDGFGACLADCNDDDASARPGGFEVCDGVDNNCNGLIDDLLTCPCDGLVIDEQPFLFCEYPAYWNRARSHCQALGGELASFTDVGENRSAYEHAQSLRPGAWYIGLGDRLDEGEWLTVAGEPARIDNWAAGEPDDFGGEDCATMAAYGGGEWADVDCNSLFPYVCRVEAE